MLKRMGMPAWVKWAMLKTPTEASIETPEEEAVPNQLEIPLTPAFSVQEVAAVASHQPQLRTLLPCYMHPVSCFGHMGRRQSRNAAFQSFRAARSFSR